MRMMFCSYCESKLPDDVTCCPNCGAPVTRVEVEEEQARQEEAARRAAEAAAAAAAKAEDSDGFGLDDLFGQSGAGSSMATIAGIAAGAELLGSLLGGGNSRRRTAARPHRMPMGGTPTRMHARPRTERREPGFGMSSGSSRSSGNKSNAGSSISRSGSSRSGSSGNKKGPGRGSGIR